ncbi:hypothetical protein [Burkholderia lata]|uniref:Uncharacterized protein n=1 Tax=Burkholderia lata (strain ATCC 17760 / DSM 23089 / LMG 22485 / NCIMB 9086 / R18194 / 383) TaxID=482957 RepID=Q39P86_BURL3|nr:hypothetical protein [Burkholderia lata]ABB05730.1 hypothetical protein Bcep18194_C6680 [Burkholderia lata]
MNRHERSTLARWIAVNQEEQARARALLVLADAPQHVEAIIAALGAATDTLSVEDADPLWAQLQAIARTTGIDNTARSTAYHRDARACRIVWNISRPISGVFLVFELE